MKPKTRKAKSLKRKRGASSDSLERMVSLAPCDCYTGKSTDRLRENNVGRGIWWIQTDGYRVTIAEQKIGNPPLQMVTLSPARLNSLVKWWKTKQRPN